ncbi:MAG: hypothetical protein ACE5HI_09655 [bacterium]
MLHLKITIICVVSFILTLKVDQIHAQKFSVFTFFRHPQEWQILWNVRNEPTKVDSLLSLIASKNINTIALMVFPDEIEFVPTFKTVLSN